MALKIEVFNTIFLLFYFISNRNDISFRNEMKQHISLRLSELKAIVCHNTIKRNERIDAMRFEVFGYTINIEHKALEDKNIPEDLRRALEIIEKYGMKAQSTEKQKKAAKHATKIRQERVKRKIQDAINLLRLKGEKITAYKVAKTASISYNTAKKYLNKTKIALERSK